MVGMLADRRAAGTMPDFELLRAIMFYIDEFPEKRHHRIETEVLFAKLRARTPLARHMLDRLEDEHVQGERRIRNLQYALLAFEMLGECRRDSFEREAEQYVHFYFSHMALEEQEVMPLAEQVLTAQDWAELDVAFESGRDPLTGRPPDADFVQLFNRIERALNASKKPPPGISG